MSDASEKSFDAPASRIAKAKREGNVPRAQEFGANLAFAAAALAVVAVAPSLGALARQAIAGAARGRIPALDAAAIVVYASAPLAAAALSGIAASLMQSGGLVVTAPTMKLERLAPAEGFKRMFSRESATHGARALAAFAVACGVMLPTLRDLVRAATAAPLPLPIALIAWRGSQRAIFAAAAVGLLFAFAEYAVARRGWLRKLRMSLWELKRELKENDGDPHIRGRRRALHRDLLRGALSSVKDASFVVVNPTHVAVALAYRPPEIAVPTVLVRASGETALRVREIAARYRIPIVENVVLARMLHRETRVGEPIGHEHYVAVAEVVAALYRSGALGA
ncbi:MAG TPA: EscU/YscU/HrcU family type III secretion system export apparatus switch protein [Candidatus Aquilonibacter sp.]